MLRVQQLSVRFGRRQRVAVDQVSFEVPDGARVGLIGESGSGKSVTALAIMGLLPENAAVTGSIELVNGERTRQLVGLGDRAYTSVRGDAISMVFQEPMTALDATMKVGRQVAEVYRLHGHGGAPGRARATVIAELASVGLDEPERIADSYPHQLSGGQRQRALLAMALANRPDLVICDEPTTALDVTVQARVLATLAERLDRHQAGCLFISHDLAVVAQLCDHVLVMHQGRLIESGPMTQVLQNPQTDYTRELIQASRKQSLAAPVSSSSAFSQASPAPVISGGPRFSARGLAVEYRRDGTTTRALDGVDLRIGAGERVGIVGESGSGKSTLLRCLLGLQRPSEGSLTGGAQGAQLVFQDPRSSLDPRMNVGRIVAEPLTGMSRTARLARVHEVLTEVGLEPEMTDRYPHEFSGGQRQRIAIARALAPRPSVLCADEPVSALDVSVRAHILDLLRRLVEREGLTLLLVSHDLGVVRQLCDRVIVLRHGRIVEQGPVAQVYDQPHELYTRELLAAVPALPIGVG